MISVVCVYNNEQSLKDNLLNGLEEQTSRYESIMIDNTKGRFKSAAESLNRGGRKAKGKYIMFAHQDVNLYSNSWLEDAEKILDPLPNLGIAGVAGMSEEGSKNKERGRNIIEHGDPPRAWSWGNAIRKPEPVQTLDECLVIIPKSVFDTLQFDEEVCNNWHLYGVDYCLSARKLGVGVYAIPIFVYHTSTGASTKNRFQAVLSLGSLPDEYYQTLGKLLKKHKNDYKRIYTTCGDWNTSYPLILQRIRHLARSGAELLWRQLLKSKQK